MATPSVKLSRGIHVMHLFFGIDREKWSGLSREAAAACLGKLKNFCQTNNAPSNPRVMSYANISGKAEMAFILFAAELGQLGAMHRELENCFPAGTLIRVYTYLSVTELPDYVTTEEDLKQTLIQQEKLDPGSEAFEKRLSEHRQRQADYEKYRLYPEMPDWEVMCFYPMTKRRSGPDNWYSLDFATRKKLMGGHARVGRKYAGRVTQLITGSTGIDDWEWGVTLLAHQTDALKEIVYEMRFDEVSARYGEFGPFYVNIRLAPDDLWEHLKL